MSIQEQYTDTLRQSQEAWAGIVKSLTDDVQAFSRSASPLDKVDSAAAIDQVFDFWVKTLESQRDVVKQLVATSGTLSERVQSQANWAGSLFREQADAATQATRKQAESVKRTERDKVASDYAELTKAELQDELDRRQLPKTGNVEELRERLVADDLK